MALEAGKMGTWDWDLKTNELIWSEMLQRILSLKPGEFQGIDSRHRSRHRAARYSSHVRPVLAGKENRSSGHRLGIVYREGHRRSSWRQDLGGKRIWQRTHILFHTASV